MRKRTVGVTTGGRIAVAGLFAALVSGLSWAPAAVAAERVATTGDTGVARPEVVDVPEAGSSWTLRRTVEDVVVVPVTTTTSGGVPEIVPVTVSGTVDTRMANGSSWT